MGPEVGEVVGAGVGDDGVPDDGLVGGIDPSFRGGPLGRHVDKDLLGVPCEQRRQVGVEGELDDGVLLLLRAVVVGAALDSGMGVSSPNRLGSQGNMRRRTLGYLWA